MILPVNWNEKVPSFLVKVFAEEDYIYFTIIDDGCGMEPEFVEAICDMKSDVGHGHYSIHCGNRHDYRNQVA